MSDENPDRELEHRLHNVQAENAALKKLLHRAADELEEIAESDCKAEDQDKASRFANRLRDVTQKSQNS